jgi:hypothetical protein
MEELIRVLTEERGLLEVLVYRLEALRHDFLTLTEQVEDLFAAVRKTVAQGYHHVNKALGPAMATPQAGTLYGPDAQVPRAVASRFEGVL